jgi:hypothetical protein
VTPPSSVDLVLVVVRAEVEAVLRRAEVVFRLAGAGQVQQRSAAI